MDKTENYVRQNKPASPNQVSNVDFHMWTLGKKKRRKLKELLLETREGKKQRTINGRTKVKAGDLHMWECLSNETHHCTVDMS